MNVDGENGSEHSSSPQEVECFVKRLEELASDVGSASALARAAGISQSGLSRYLHGGEPTRPVLIAIARAAGVNLLWLMTGEPPKRAGEANDNDGGSAQTASEHHEDEWLDVPLFNVRAGAGFGRLNHGESIRTYLKFRKYSLRRAGLPLGSLAALQIEGDSMEPSLFHGDTVLVDLESTQPDSGGIFVVIYGDSLLAKRVQLRPDGGLRISSDNPVYKDEIVGPQQRDQVHIAGRVKWLARFI